MSSFRPTYLHEGTEGCSSLCPSTCSLLPAPYTHTHTFEKLPHIPNIFFPHTPSTRTTQDKVDALGLPRTARFFGAAAAAGVLFLTVSWTHACIGLLVTASYWRTLLVPREVR